MRWMNKLKIAVLDNGVDEKLLALCGLPDIIQQNKGNISDEEDLFLHGTNLIIPELSEPPVRTLGATIPENESHIFVNAPYQVP